MAFGGGVQTQRLFRTALCCSGSRILLLGAGLLAPLLLPAPALGAEISRAVTSDGRGALHYDGDVTEGDFKNLKEEVEVMRRSGTPVELILLNSNGGLVAEGVLMGRFLHQNGIATAVERGKHCFSSCISIFAGGVPRTAFPGARMGVHRANHDSQDTRDARAVSISMNDFYREWKVPDSIRMAMIDTPPDKLYLLTEDEMRRFSTSSKGSGVSALRPVVTTSPEKAKEHVLDTKIKALEFMDQGQPLEAARMLEQVKALAPTDHELFDMLGRAHHMSGNRKQAIISFTSAVKINPSYPDSWRSLGELVADEGNTEWATQCFMKYYGHMEDKELAFSVLEGISYRSRGSKRDLAAAAARRQIRR